MNKTRRFVSKVFFAGLFAALLFLTGCGINITGGLGKDAGNYTAGGVSIGDKIEYLDIEWANKKIEIIAGDVDSIIIDEEDKNLPEDQKVQWWIEGSTLRVRYAKANVMGNVNKNIKITVPKEVVFKDVKASVASAELILENISAENMAYSSASGNISGSGLNTRGLDLDSASGKIIIKDCSSESIKGNSASGKINISVSGCKKGDFSSASGGVELDFSDVPENLKVDTASGSVEVALPADANFTADIDTASGRVTLDIPTTSANGKYVAGDGKNSIKIDTASGNVHIKGR